MGMSGNRERPGLLRGGPSRQDGLAAIEFSLTVCLMLLILSAIVGYGALFWAQQRLAYAAGEGARAVLDASHRGDAQALAACAAARDAAGWLAVACEPAVQACQWDGGGDSDCVSVTVTYDTAAWPMVRMLRYLPAAGGQGWVPAQLVAQATVQVDAESVQ